jgi:hypothetical protein
MAARKPKSAPKKAKAAPSFDSPLKARWAVFLTALGTPFEYQAEAHQFRSQTYRPDFWVADWNSWIEVLPEQPQKLDVFRALDLSRNSGRQVLMLIGEPAEYTIVLFDPSGYFAKEGSAGWQFAQGQNDPNEIWLASEDGAFTLKPLVEDEGEAYPLMGEDATTIMDALYAAHTAEV